MRLAMILMMTALAGCATGPKLPITQPVIDLVSASAENHPNFDRPDLIEVRSILVNGFEWQEISGSQCSIKANGVTRNFTPPALIQVPMFYGKTRSLLIQCRNTINGISRVSGTTLEPKNLSAPDDEGVTISVGSEGTSVGAVVSLRNRNKDRFDFQRKVNVSFAP